MYYIPYERLFYSLYDEVSLKKFGQKILTLEILK